MTLIGQLSQVRALGVVSRNGVEPYRGSALPEDSIARALEVGTLIAGSVEENRGRIRVTTRLVDGVSGADFQRDNFELPADAELELGDSLAQEVSRFLRERLGEEIRLRERRAATSSTEAWSLVQRAERLRKDALERADADLAGAFDTFEAADSIAGAAEVADPDWAEPVVLRGRIAYERVRLTEDAYDAVPWIEAGLGHAERGMEIERNYPEALALRGMLRYAHWELRVTEDPEEWRALLDGARQDLETAVNLDPTLAEAHVTLSYLYYQIDDVPAALLAARRAFEEDAYLSEANDVLWRLFWGSLDLEQFNQARRWCAEGTRRFPEDFRFSHCQLWLMATPATHAEVERAWELRESVEALAPEGRGDFARVQAHMLTAGAIARAGLVDSARAVLDAARARVTHDIDPTQDLLAVQAYVLTLIGDKDEAIDLLKQYKAANPDHGFEHTAGTVWWWRELRSHPRFREVTEP
ncbi:MAG: hypothetical protein GTO46_14915 [Gemmatimonadetes bacterium]|nr:hypothetical protein [Gemmatimonadota bacterium]NIO32847.1 hypothetical protein [Gemmatimonadota bacterium]